MEGRNLTLEQLELRVRALEKVVLAIMKVMSGGLPDGYESN